ncbi:MAG: NADH-quinone oxidoreductase subunit H [Candidatus Schekmanbacteria bacterium]|nr:NADH-quinone oxidoreductase subunit H [Candidatus Schekmanbacteria bacterium]
MQTIALVHPALALVLSPLLLGVINRTKAIFAGRVGQPLAQPYRDLWKLLRKGAVYSRTTTWVFRAAPVVGLAAILLATTLLPLAALPALLAFPGDFILLAYLLGLVRFFAVIGALDTGSSFEGMGASREVQFSALAEPALLLGLAAVAYHTHSLSLSEMISGLSSTHWSQAGAMQALLAASLFMVLLTENARIPVDDPNTHLELTMIHEVMVLDFGGPDFAFILYGASLKLWVFCALLTGLALPVRTGNLWIEVAVAVIAIFGIAVLVGVVESCMARLRLIRIPQLLVGAGLLSVLALVLSLR